MPGGFEELQKLFSFAKNIKLINCICSLSFRLDSVHYTFYSVWLIFHGIYVGLSQHTLHIKVNPHYSLTIYSWDLCWLLVKAHEN